MKTALILWAAVSVLALLLALSWGYFARPRLHGAPAPGSPLRAACRCPDCGRIPYYDRPECTRCGGMGFVTSIEETQHG